MTKKNIATPGDKFHIRSAPSLRPERLERPERPEYYQQVPRSTQTQLVTQTQAALLMSRNTQIPQTQLMTQTQAALLVSRNTQAAQIPMPQHYSVSKPKPKFEPKLIISPASTKADAAIVSADPPPSESPNEQKIGRWEKISLVVFLTSLIGFTLGSVFAIALLDGSLKIGKEEIMGVVQYFQISK